MVSKEILIQYSDLQEEVKEVRERIEKTEKQIAKIEEEENVTDTVSGGSGGIQHFKIEGRTMKMPDILESYIYYMILPEYRDKIRLQALRQLL